MIKFKEDNLRQQSRKIRAKLSNSFDDLVEKMKNLAEQRFSPTTLNYQERRLEDIIRTWEDSSAEPEFAFNKVEDQENFAKPKIFDGISPLPFEERRTPVLSSTPIMPRLISRGNQTPDRLSPAEDGANSSLSLDDIMKFHDPDYRPNHLPVPDQAAFLTKSELDKIASDMQKRENFLEGGNSKSA